MPVYNYIHPSTGISIEYVRSVDERNEPLTLTFSRSPVPEKPGRIIIGGVPEDYNADFRKACYQMEQTNPDAWKTGKPKSDYLKALSLPEPPRGPGAEGTYSERNGKSAAALAYQRMETKKEVAAEKELKKRDKGDSQLI